MEIAIVEEIRDPLLGKLMPFSMVTQALPDSPLWEEFRCQRRQYSFIQTIQGSLVTQLGPTKIIQTHGHLFDINFNFKSDFWREEDADTCLYGRYMFQVLGWKGALF